MSIPLFAGDLGFMVAIPSIPITCCNDCEPAPEAVVLVVVNIKNLLIVQR